MEKEKQTNRIREIIREKGLTMTEMAERLGITRQGLGQIIDTPSYPTLMRFAEVLEVPVWQLFVTAEDAAKWSPTPKVTLDLGLCPHCGQPVKLCLGLEKG